ncbi:MAG: 3-methyl-2-oxobutanoate hydroxymethyltransferase [Verrucomicrobiota bacterium]
MKLSPKELTAMKSNEQIAMLTAYNCPIARYIEKVGVPVILVGDTLAMVEMGHDSTRPITIENMEYHVGAVRRGAPDTHLIGDLPYLTYEEKGDALRNSIRLLEAGADSVKLEGGKIEIISHLCENGIDVVGHTGLTPQTASNFRRVGGSREEYLRILEEAKQITKAGAFMLVLEHIPEALGKEITDSISIPTIGIGAGSDCDGQVLVTNDALGIGDSWPPFSKQYAYLGEVIVDALSTFKEEVESKSQIAKQS